MMETKKINYIVVSLLLLVLGVLTFTCYLVQSDKQPVAITPPQIPDNLTTILQDFNHKFSQQNQAIKTLESLIVSDLNPKINFLLDNLKQQKNNDNQNNVALPLVGLMLQSANMYIKVLHDPKTATQLLEAAASLLVDQNHPSLHESIVTDQKTLADIHFPDKNLILSSLNDMLKNLDKYPYKTSKPPTQPKEQKSLQNVFQKLKSLIKIKQQPTEQISYALQATEDLQRQRLRFFLEQALTVSCGEDTEHYQSLLNTAKSILTGNFEIDDPLIQQAVSTIENLTKIELKYNPVELTSLKQFARINSL